MDKMIGLYGHPLPQNGGGSGRGQPRLSACQLSLAAPTPSLPRFGGGGFAMRG